MGHSFKRQTDIIITNTFKKKLDKSNCKPSKMWVDECIEFCNRSMKS